METDAGQECHYIGRAGNSSRLQWDDDGAGNEIPAARSSELGDGRGRNESPISRSTNRTDREIPLSSRQQQQKPLERPSIQYNISSSFVLLLFNKFLLHGQISLSCHWTDYSLWSPVSISARSEGWICCPTQILKIRTLSKWRSMNWDFINFVISIETTFPKGSNSDPGKRDEETKSNDVDLLLIRNLLESSYKFWILLGRPRDHPSKWMQRPESPRPTSYFPPPPRWSFPLA